MSVEISPITDRSLRVSNKVVYQDTSDNWVAVTELTSNETEALNNYINAKNGRPI